MTLADATILGMLLNCLKYLRLIYGMIQFLYCCFKWKVCWIAYFVYCQKKKWQYKKRSNIPCYSILPEILLSGLSLKCRYKQKILYRKKKVFYFGLTEFLWMLYLFCNFRSPNEVTSYSITTSFLPNIDMHICFIM